MLRRSVAAFLLMCSAALRADPRPPDAGIKTFVVVRHAEAETAPHGADPVLTADGQQRALELARVLGDLPLHAIYSTRYQRNRETAEPLVRRTGRTVIVVAEVAATLNALRAEPWGTTSLVVGHSNTVPQLIAGLTGRAFPDGDKVAFDRMWIITVARGGGIALLELHYGAPVAAR